MGSRRVKQRIGAQNPNMRHHSVGPNVSKSVGKHELLLRDLEDYRRVLRSCLWRAGVEQRPILFSAEVFNRAKYTLFFLELQPIFNLFSHTCGL